MKKKYEEICNCIKKWIDTHSVISICLQYVYILIPLFFSSSYNFKFWIPYFLFFVISLIITVAKEQNKKTNQQLEKENQDLKNENQNLHKVLVNVPKYYVESIYRKLNLSESQRITLYQLSNDKKNLVNLARHSKNAKYTEKGRTQYPKNQGIIGECFNKGTCEVTRKLEEKNENTWIKNHKKDYSIHKKILENIKMKSIIYIGQRIEKDSDLLGVVLFESMGKVENIDEIKKELESPFFRDLLSKYKNYLPNIDNAKNQNF